MKDEGSNHAHTSPIQTPKQLIVVVVLAFLIPVVGIILLTQFVTSGKAPSPQAMDPEAVAARIKPVADVAMAGSTDASAGQAAQAAATSGGDAPAAVASGESVYKGSCAACHATGAAGAPTFGDKGAWGPRVAKGKDALYKSAIGGLNAMPPKGGNTSLSDDAVKAAVDYMVDAVK